MGNYILTMRDGSTERWEVDSFNLCVAYVGERIGSTFESRLDQFQRYTGLDVVDWMMED